MNLSEFQNLSAMNFESAWRSPSNIAFVKYWGKKGHQLPANPSLSMTLKECYTETFVKFTPSDTLSVELYFDGEINDKFAEKIRRYLSGLGLPWMDKVLVTINTTNTFPHGAGIASSASGLSAFALCLTDYLFYLSESRMDFLTVASSLARLASGSACRSVYGGFTTWGDVSQDYASELQVHPSMQRLRDSVVVIDGSEKKISSTIGHGQMLQHYFREARYLQARDHFSFMKSALITGDFETMGRILEAEALSLHAMMLTSPESYTLLRPSTLQAIESVRTMRAETQLPLYFTLDAGPNLHLIYPEEHEPKIKTFISTELASLAEEILHDECGEGPQRC